MIDESKPHVCPWWLGYFLINPLRRFLENPDQIVGPHVREGMTVLEVGPGMGYFTLPLAHMVGANGRVICVDVQEKMLEKLRKRVAKASLLERITTILASQDSLCLKNYRSSIDFAFVFAVAHEVPDQSKLFEEVHRAVKLSGLLLFAEPKGHVKPQDFERSVEFAQANGFEVVKSLDIRRYHSVLMKNQSAINSTKYGK